MSNIVAADLEKLGWRLLWAEGGPAMREDLLSWFEFSGMPVMYLPKIIGDEYENGSRWVITHGILGFNGIFHDRRASHDVTMIGVELPGKLPGKISLIDAKSPTVKYVPENELESNQFNRETKLYSWPKKLAWHTLTPDFMWWYMEQSPRPWVQISQNHLALIFEGIVKPDQIQSLLVQSIKVFHFLESSSALER